MTGLTRRQWLLLGLLTLVWGCNWPVMKIGVSAYPPLGFRALSMLLGLPVLGAALVVLKVPFAIERRHWPELGRLALFNMMLWHVLAILAVQWLSSGRAAILGYTMPVFSALWGYALYGERLSTRQTAGVAAATLGAALLLWHEAAKLSGAPVAAGMMLIAATAWALGTQQLRRTRIGAPTLAIAFWMTALTTGVMAVLALMFEQDRLAWPNRAAWWAIGYNAVLIFGYAHAAWFLLARSLPPAASTVSVMLIPVVGTVSGAWVLGERLHWQDGAAAALMVLAIASVLLPAARPSAARPA